MTNTDILLDELELDPFFYVGENGFPLNLGQELLNKLSSSRTGEERRRWISVCKNRGWGFRDNVNEPTYAVDIPPIDSWVTIPKEV